jgi:ABC-type nitrate/sulfonate/bicarbonate transport system ATPase subunit
MGREPGKTQKILILRHIFKQNPPILPWKIIYNNVNIVNFLKNATDCKEIFKSKFRHQAIEKRP